MAQWITRLTTDQKIPGSNPGTFVLYDMRETRMRNILGESIKGLIQKVFQEKEMEYKDYKTIRMEDLLYDTELFHDAITKWHNVRSKIVEIVKMPHQVFRKPPDPKDENKEKELDLLCQDFKQLNEETLKYVNHQIIRMVEIYSDINCLRRELLHNFVDKFKTLTV